MRYLMLVRVPEDAAPTPAEADPAPWHAEALRRGQHLAGQRLRPPRGRDHGALLGGLADRDPRAVR